MGNVDIGRLSDEITSQLKRYSQVVSDDVEQIADELATEGVERIKSNIRDKKLIRSGRYLKGWTKRKVGKSVYIHNKTDYQLTHLLEDGHAMVNGGRVLGTPHIGPVEEWIVAEYENRIEKAIEK
ncbi:HK97 gp10 family phage protein [Bacillus thuringiensis]|uniref:HK97 gp10 family phage protein n=1 Tax=Bacillus thuringiensis TaxID=1428 RepID=UPI003A8736F3